MKVTDLEPNAYWETDLIDIHLGQAVQQAWEEGQAAAKQGHEAEQAMQQRVSQMKGGRAQC